MKKIKNNLKICLEKLKSCVILIKVLLHKAKFCLGM